MEIIIIVLSVLIASFASMTLKHRRSIEYLSIAGSFVAFVGSIMLSYKIAVSRADVSFAFFSVDALGAIAVLLVAFVGFMAVTYSVVYFREETAKHIIGFTRVKEYFILVNLFLTVMFLAVMSSNPIFTWITIEATTLSTAFLISFYDKPSAMEAAWKYLIVNSIGLLLGFFGTLLYFTSLHASDVAGLVTWNHLMSGAVLLDPTTAKIAFVFVLIGYGTKIGLVPMHTWLPDAHSKAPVPVSALLSGVLLNVAFVTMLRFKAVTDVTVGEVFSQKLLIVFGALSILVAVFIIIGQKNYKRLLAYSSIENMGILALGFGFGGLAVYAAILHMIYHSLIKSALFLSAGNIFLKYSSTKVVQVKGLFTTLPVTSGMFLVGFLAITGMPPFGIFLTKVGILSEGVRVYPAVSALVLCLTAILFVGFLKIMVDMLFGEKPADVKVGEANVWLLVPPITLLGVAFVLSLYIPPFIQTLITIVTTHY